MIGMVFRAKQAGPAKSMSFELVARGCGEFHHACLAAAFSWARDPGRGLAGAGPQPAIFPSPDF